MLVGFNARVRAGPRAAGACFPLSACPWEVLPGFSARVRAEPRAACACFPLPACHREAIPKLGLGFSAGSGQSPELLGLVFPLLLVLRQVWKLCHALFSKPSARQESAGISGAGAELCRGVVQSGCGFSLFQGLKISGVLKSLWTSPSDSG